MYHRIRYLILAITLAMAVQFPYELQGRLDFYLGEHQVAVVDKTYTDTITYQLRIPQSKFEFVRSTLVDMSQGRLLIIGP